MIPNTRKFILYPLICADCKREINETEDFNFTRKDRSKKYFFQCPECASKEWDRRHKKK